MHEIRVSPPEARHCVVEASGELDMAATGDLCGAVATIDPRQAEWIIVDLAGVTLIDSSAIKELVDAHHAAAERGQILLVRNARPIVLRVLRVTGVAAVLGIAPADQPGTVYGQPGTGPDQAGTGPGSGAAGAGNAG
ncbi:MULTISPECIES: STAS domain-containing protein [unclassified Solwaraspora]|uniref:STAS domain-containing protein n=1 Tax=unclassified Solwaraspora TaxID=2627926 RepID=UPI00259BC7A6|nr:STAS domain-containing protein [Solwaraspora sp. WMMA2056]WJK41275.1 STAS domain-containing protein [Solwaraspora sp. WMMA2056]